MKMSGIGKMNRDEKAVSPVIATILMVAITVVLAGVLVLYMNQIANPQGGGAVTVTSTVNSESNPSVGADTLNGGIWVVKVAQVSAVVQLSSLTLTVTDAQGAQIGNFKPIETLSTGATGGVGTPTNVYCLQGTGTIGFDADPATDAAVFVQQALPTTGISGAEILTMQSAIMCLLDADSNQQLNSLDVIYVYKSNDGNAVQDTPNGAKLQFKVGGASTEATLP